MTRDTTVHMPLLLRERHPFRQWKTWTIPNTQLTLTGYSRSGDKTFFDIPELRCCLDAGLCEGRLPDHVFVTHTHNDHIEDIDFLAGKSTGVSIYLPLEAQPYLESYIRARRELNHMAPFDESKAGAIHYHGVKESDVVSLGSKGQYRVRVVPCVHKIACVGYAFSEVRKRLKPEFASLRETMSQQEFGQLLGDKRKAGEEVQEEVEQPLFVFMGDTHATVFAENDWLFSYPVIITECTFLYDEEKERAKANGHTLWSELRPFVEAHPECTFVLTHFSLRYSDKEIVEFFSHLKKESPERGLQQLVVWARPDSIMQEKHQPT